MKNFRIYRPNLSDYKVIIGTHMIVTPEGKANIWNETLLVATIPNNVTVIMEQSISVDE